MVGRLDLGEGPHGHRELLALIVGQHLDQCVVIVHGGQQGRLDDAQGVHVGNLQLALDVLQFPDLVPGPLVLGDAVEVGHQVPGPLLQVVDRWAELPADGVDDALESQGQVPQDDGAPGGLHHIAHPVLLQEVHHRIGPGLEIHGLSGAEVAVVVGDPHETTMSVAVTLIVSS